MLIGQGGNLGVSIGEDGTFLIDDQFAPMTDKIMAAINLISKDPVRYVINTHWHGDHTGGNENIDKVWAVIVAHENVRQRMNQVNGDAPTSPEGALPVITFSEDMSFYQNGHDIHISHQRNAHTDSDSFIYFKDANVIHAGDMFFEWRPSIR